MDSLWKSGSGRRVFPNEQQKLEFPEGWGGGVQAEKPSVGGSPEYFLELHISKDTFDGDHLNQKF